MKKLILPSLLLLAGIGASVPVWSAQPPCLYHPEVAGCIGSMPSDYGSSGSKSPIVRYETSVKSTTGQIAISQPNGSQSWKMSYAKVGVSRDTAMEECRSQDNNCTELFQFKNTCASLTSGGFRQANDGQSLFIATGKTKEQAIAKATQQCQANSKGNCQVLQALCTSNYGYTQGYRF